MSSPTALALQRALPQAEDAFTALRPISYEQLKQLPAVQTAELAGFEKRVTLTTYMDVLQAHNADVQVVVQLVAYGRLHSSHVWARGFRISKDGSCRDLVEKELYEYS